MAMVPPRPGNIYPESTRPRSLESVRAAVAELRRLRQRIAARTAGKPKLTLAEAKSAIAEGRQ